MKNGTYLPKLDGSMAQEHQEQAWKKKKKHWTLLPQCRTRANGGMKASNFFLTVNKNIRHGLQGDKAY